MHSLREIQFAISRAVRSESAVPAAGLLRDDGIEPAQRLQIYRNNHRLGSLATLKATYPVIERLAGADWFAGSAAHYAASFPSTSGDLQSLGEHYPAFLRDVLADTEYVYFADVAALEWAYQCVLTAVERPPVALEKLRSFAPDDYERLAFIPRPALRIIHSPYPLLAIWQANQAQGTDANAAIRMDGGETRVLLMRRNDHVELRNIGTGSGRLLREFLLGRPLGPAAEAAAADLGGFDLDAALTEVVRLEAIADIELTLPPDQEHPQQRTP